MMSLLIGASTFAQLNTGDIAFVGFNADGNDDFSIVTFVDIAPNTTLFFSDNELTSDGVNLGFNTGENHFSWNSGSNTISRGTVIVFSYINTLVAAELKTNFGSVTTIFGPNAGLSGSDEALFIYTGSYNAPTKFISAFGTDNEMTAFGTLAGTNLVLGTSAFTTVAFDADADIAEYIGSRDNFTTPGFLTNILYNASNWITQDASGDQSIDLTFPDVPFSLQPFTPGNDDLLPTLVNYVIASNKMEATFTFNEPLNSITAVNLSNYTVAGLIPSNAVISPNSRIVSLTLAGVLPGGNRVVSILGIGDVAGNYYISPLVLNIFVPDPTFSFARISSIAGEALGVVNLNISIFAPFSTPMLATLTLSGMSTVDANDISFPISITIPGNTTSFMVPVTITNDALIESDEVAIFKFASVAQGSIASGAAGYHALYIKDDDSYNVVPSNQITLNYLKSFNTSLAGTGANSAEITAYDKDSKRLFTVNSLANRIDIFDLSNPSAPVSLFGVNLSSLTASFGGISLGINSVAFKNGVLATAFENTTDGNANGFIGFFNANGQFLNYANAGVLPDMVTFSPDGKYCLSANEGQPNVGYTADGEGSVTIVDMANLTTASPLTVRQITLGALNSQYATLKSQGVRLFGTVSGVLSTVAQDLEPEYITLSSDSKTAYVSLQENNALAIIDVVAGTITGIKSLGLKDYSATRAGIDASRRDINGDGVVNINDVVLTNWKGLKGMYMPDAIASANIGGNTFIFSANEGDARADYGSAFNEESNVTTNSLSGINFSDLAALRSDRLLGDMNITKASGDNEGDGIFEEIHTFGTRSFTIWDAAGNKVWDSGDDFERITSTSTFNNYFNASNGSSATVKGRSNSKGPEAEGITVANIANEYFAFISLERMGGVMVYNVTNPIAPVFVTYTNSRANGDLGPEGLLYIPSAESPTGKSLLIMSNEISSTFTVYEVTVSGALLQNPTAAFNNFTLTIGGASANLSNLLVTNSSGIKVFSVLGTAASLSGNTLTPVNAGQVTVLGFVNASTEFNSTLVSSIVTVVTTPAVNPTISFSSATLTVGGAGIDLSVLLTTNSTGAKSFSILSGTAAALAGNTLSPVSAGSVTVTGSVAAASGFNAGSANAVFTVVTVPGVVCPTIASETVNLNLTVGGSYLISSAINGTPTISGSISISGNTITAVALGQATVIALTGGVCPYDLIINITVSGTSSITAGADNDFAIYPNPIKDGVLYFTKILTGSVLNSSGIEVKAFEKTSKIDVADLPKGLYLLKTEGKGYQKFVVE